MTVTSFLPFDTAVVLVLVPPEADHKNTMRVKAVHMGGDSKKYRQRSVKVR